MPQAIAALATMLAATTVGWLETSGGTPRKPTPSARKKRASPNPPQTAPTLFSTIVTSAPRDAAPACRATIDAMSRHQEPGAPSGDGTGTVASSP